MAAQINGQTYFRTAEVCKLIGISRTTLFRWLREGVLNEARYRDRRGWRLFSEHELDKFRAVAHELIENNQPSVWKTREREKEYVKAF